VVPSLAPVELGRSRATKEPREIDPSCMPRLSRLPWAILLKRVFLVDVLECPKCRGRMKILTAVVEPASVRRVLASLGLPSEAPRLQPARSPPQLELGGGEAALEGFYPDPPNPEW